MVEAPPKRQPVSAADRSQRLFDGWVRNMVDLVAVENGITDQVVMPIRDSTSRIRRYLESLYDAPKDLQPESVLSIIRPELRTGWATAHTDAQRLLKAFGRRWWAVQARTILRNTPPKRIAALSDHVKRTYARRRFGIKGAESIVEDATSGLSISFADVEADIFRAMGDFEMVGYLQNDMSPRLTAAFDRAFAANADAALQAVAEALQLDESMDDVISALESIMSSAEFRVETVVRTEAQQIAFDSEDMLLEYLEPMVAKVVYTAIIDGRTCLRCAQKNGKEWRVADRNRPKLPLHNCCRCSYVPVTRGTPSPAITSYPEWFAHQRPGLQRDILGATRFDLYRQGTPIDRFVNRRGRILRVSELPSPRPRKKIRHQT